MLQGDFSIGELYAENGKIIPGYPKPGYRSGSKYLHKCGLCVQI
jgi:hypothetical protein